MIVDRAGRSDLHYAAVDGRLDDVRRLIDEGADVAAADTALMTPLHMACHQGHVEVARALLSAGADPDSKNLSGRSPRDLAQIMNRPGIKAVLA